MYRFRLRWRRLGGHVHTSLFIFRDGTDTGSSNGQLIFRLEEWPDARAMFERAGVEVLQHEEIT